jgi:hypothetical protein
MKSLWCAEMNLSYTATYIEDGNNKLDWYVVVKGFH